MENKKLVSKILQKNADTKSSFPQNLTEEETNFYINEMKNGNKKAEEILINHNMRLVVHIVKKYKPSLDFDDLISIGSISLIKGVRSFKPEKNIKLSTFLAICIDNEVKMALRKLKRHKTVSLDAPVPAGKDNEIGSLLQALNLDENYKLEDILENKIIRHELLKFMREFLTEEKFKIMCWRFGLADGIIYTQVEVAKMLNISRSYVSRLCSSAINTLKENIDFFETTMNKYT